MKRICMLVLNHVTSDPRVTKEAAFLSQSGYEVTVAGICQDEQMPVYERKEGYRIERAKYPNSGLLKNSSLSKMTRKLRSIIDVARVAWRINADVYHAHDLEMLPAAAIIAKLKGVLLVYDSHELWVEQNPSFPKWFKSVARFVERVFIQRVDRVITVNDSIARELTNRYHLKEQPVILHNYTRLLNDPSIVAASREAATTIRVLYHGGYIKDRGLSELIAAVTYLPEHVQLVFRGMGYYEDELRQQAESYVKLNRVIFLPPVPLTEMVGSAKDAEIGIIPYQPTCLNNYYSLPNKLSEYAMAGLAICASDLPEIRNLNDRAQFGELFDPYSPHSIANAITKLAQNREYLMQCKSRALHWAHTEGNWEHESGKLLEVYKRLLGDNHEKSMDR